MKSRNHKIRKISSATRITDFPKFRAGLSMILRVLSPTYLDFKTLIRIRPIWHDFHYEYSIDKNLNVHKEFCWSTYIFDGIFSASNTYAIYYWKSSARWSPAPRSFQSIKARLISGMWAVYKMNPISYQWYDTT